MPITLTSTQVDDVRNHAEAAFPHECCGLLLGHVNGKEKSVAALFRTNNARKKEDQHHRFLIDPRDFMQAEQRARQQNMDVIGVYHSHPNEAAQPSAYDVDHAWPWYSYVIVSVQAGKADDLTSWTLRDDRSAFDQESINVNTESTRA